MIQVVNKDNQAQGAFNGGEIVENKPIGFNREGGELKPYSNIFYWANAKATVDSTIGLHPHQGFEIMSFVLEGKVKHYDTKVDDWLSLSKGDVQIIRAGNGISHSEFMAEGARMFQIWLDPNLNKTMAQPASYDDYKANDFQTTSESAIVKTHYAGLNGLIKMDTPDILIEKWDIKQDYTHLVGQENILSMYVLNGRIQINSQTIEKDEFALISDEHSIHLSGTGTVFIIKSLKNIGYLSYSQLMKKRLYT